MKNNNKRIAKNTLMLYFRMMLTLIVSLYTVRVVLNTLGAVDYGIYNVVGGLVTMFSFLSNTMASASQRFFAFEIGRKNYDQLKKIFSMSITIYVLIAIVILLLGETIGLWFLNTKMVIPPNRMEAANWIYQFSILSFMMTMFTIPYDAAIIAHERMNVYAWVSIVEVLLKLLIVYLLVFFSFDKLKLYSILIFLVTTIVTFIYRSYCIKKFEECRYTFYWNKRLFSEIMSFSGWNLVGTLSAILKNYGVNILLNMFFGPIINAARGISFQINSAIMQFVVNFTQAVNPQITKYYATGEKDNLEKLVFRSAKISFYLLFLLSAPVMLEANFILTLWLKRVPDYTILFVRLIIVASLIDTFSYPLITSALATGKIKKYQITVGGLLLLNLPISYFLLKFGFPPESTLFVLIGISFLALCYRLINLKKMIDFPIWIFFKSVIIRAILVSTIAVIPSFFLLEYLHIGILRFIINTISLILFSLIVIYGIGLSKPEKLFVFEIVKSKLPKTNI